MAAFISARFLFVRLAPIALITNAWMSGTRAFEAPVILVPASVASKLYSKRFVIVRVLVSAANRIGGSYSTTSYASVTRVPAPSMWSWYFVPTPSWPWVRVTNLTRGFHVGVLAGFATKLKLSATDLRTMVLARSVAGTRMIQATTSTMRMTAPGSHSGNAPDYGDFHLELGRPTQF